MAGRFCFVFLFFVSSTLLGQENHWIYFKNRDLSKKNVISEKTSKNRTRLNLPVYQLSDYGPGDSEVQLLKSFGIEIRQTSKWFNAVSAQLKPEQIGLIKNLPFVSGIEKFTTTGFLSTLDTNQQIYMTFPLTQINAVAFFNQGWVGEGVDIGVVDGGFHNLHKSLYTSHLVENNRIIEVKDFFEPNRKEIFSDKRNNGELHGTHVTGYIGGYSQKDRAITGIALRSNYYLARSETSGRESRIEEDNWIAALEWLDSLGVRLVNSSLGYALGFTDPAENYSPTQMDGKTSVIALGAKKAVLEKGMIIVSSAGNEGESKPWKGLVSTPGDVSEVISVGATTPEGLKMSYSSIGPDFTDFIKPDVSVFSTNGTSLAAPVVTGIVAGMLQEYPELTWEQVKNILQSSSNLSNSPNNYVGYGYPDLQKIQNILKGKNEATPIKTIVAVNSYELDTSSDVAVFHKKNSTIVISQELLSSKKGKVKIIKPKDATHCTFLVDGKPTEIIWKL